MAIEVRTVSYVHLSDLLTGMSEKMQDAVTSHIADSVTWGDAFHTMIHAYRIVDILDIDNLEVNEEGYEELKLLRDRIMPLGASAMVDLEH